MTKTILVPALLCAALLGGCFGGGAPVKVPHTTVTKAQEFQDLQGALQQGAITQKEYEELRTRIMRRKD
ncbi:MAG TPA: hypothetical protein VGI57_10475 [Usitatibacter sp.]|jgi:hypothetical protein